MRGNKVVPKRVLPVVDRQVRPDNIQPLSESVKIEDLRKYFHLPIVEVARQPGTCTTALKKVSRKNKINKRPYRQIRSITKIVLSLEMASLNDTLSEDLRIQYRQKIVTLQNAIDELIIESRVLATEGQTYVNEQSIIESKGVPMWRFLARLEILMLTYIPLSSILWDKGCNISN
jgi:hypothetical protein